MDMLGLGEYGDSSYSKTTIFIEKRKYLERNASYEKMGEEMEHTRENVCVLLGRIADQIEKDKRLDIENAYRLAVKTVTTTTRFTADIYSK